MTVLELISRFKRSQYIDIRDMQAKSDSYQFSGMILTCPPEWYDRKVLTLSIRAVPHYAPRLIIFLG